MCFVKTNGENFVTPDCENGKSFSKQLLGFVVQENKEILHYKFMKHRSVLDSIGCSSGCM